MANTTKNDVFEKDIYPMYKKCSDKVKLKLMKSINKFQIVYLVTLLNSKKHRESRCDQICLNLWQSKYTALLIVKNFMLISIPHFL